MSAVTDLAAAVRDALDLPSAVGVDGWHERANVAAARAAHVRGALSELAEGDDIVVIATINVIRKAAEWHPVNYPVRDESPCLRGKHARCAGCADCPQNCHPEQPGSGS